MNIEDRITKIKVVSDLRLTQINSFRDYNLERVARIISSSEARLIYMGLNPCRNLTNKNN